MTLERLTGRPLVAQLVKNLSAMQETQFRFLSQEVPLQKEMATPVSFWSENPGVTQSTGSQESDMTW